jgi:hypothetical protein
MITGSQGSGDDHFRVFGLVELRVTSHLHCQLGKSVALRRRHLRIG